MSILPAAQATLICQEVLRGAAYPAGQVVSVNTQGQQAHAQLLSADMAAQQAQQDSRAGKMHGPRPGMAKFLNLCADAAYREQQPNAMSVLQDH